MGCAHWCAQSSPWQTVMLSMQTASQLEPGGRLCGGGHQRGAMLICCGGRARLCSSHAERFAGIFQGGRTFRCRAWQRYPAAPAAAARLGLQRPQGSVPRSALRDCARCCQAQGCACCDAPPAGDHECAHGCRGMSDARSDARCADCGACPCPATGRCAATPPAHASDVHGCARASQTTGFTFGTPPGKDEGSATQRERRTCCSCCPLGAVLASRAHGPSGRQVRVHLHVLVVRLRCGCQAARAALHPLKLQRMFASAQSAAACICLGTTPGWDAW